MSLKKIKQIICSYQKISEFWSKPKFKIIKLRVLLCSYIVVNSVRNCWIILQNQYYLFIIEFFHPYLQSIKKRLTVFNKCDDLQDRPIPREKLQTEKKILLEKYILQHKYNNKMFSMS